MKRLVLILGGLVMGATLAQANPIVFNRCGRLTDRYDVCTAHVRGHDHHRYLVLKGPEYRGTRVNGEFFVASVNQINRNGNRIVQYTSYVPVDNNGRLTEEIYMLEINHGRDAGRVSRGTLYVNGQIWIDDIEMVDR